jgi:predicted NBD/HSP70 family sugar kinase
VPTALAPPSRADQTTVRRSNLGVVLQHVANHGPCSRAQIAGATGLTRGTVSSLVGELVQLELLKESCGDEPARRVGRPAQPLELAGAVAAIGLEVNVDYLAVALEDLTGRIRYERRVFVDNRRSTPGPVLDSLARMADAAIAAAARDGLLVAGLALAVPGLVEPGTGTVLRAPNLGWSRLSVVAELSARLPGFSIHVENEANLAALAEHWQGAARDAGTFICVFGEIGVGAGIFVDGRLYRGVHGFGGELGHVAAVGDGELCACGARGCLETVTGQEAIARRAGVPIEDGGRTRSITTELVRRAEAGDAAVLAALAEAGRALGLAVASAVNLFDLGLVVLGGCFGSLAPWLSGHVEEALRRRVLAAEWSASRVVASEIGELAAVRGAAALLLREVLASPWKAPSRPPVRQTAAAS